MSRDGYKLPVSRTDGRRKLSWKKHPIHRAKFEARMKTRKRNREQLALNTLARNGLTIEDALTMSDKELLALPNLGRISLEFIRTLTP